MFQVVFFSFQIHFPVVPTVFFHVQKCRYDGGRNKKRRFHREGVGRLKVES